MRNIAVVNQKGGVGKTTTAVNIAYSLAKEGHRVLLVDLDPQGNATTSLGIDPYKIEKTTYDVLVDAKHNIEIAIQRTELANLEVLPSNVDLAGAEIALSRDLVGGVTKLRRALQTIADNYRFILVDCPPSLGILTLNALAASTDVLIPIQVQHYALKGMKELQNTILRVREELGIRINLLGILMTQFHKVPTVHRVISKEILDYFGAKVFKTIISQAVKIQESDLKQEPVVKYAPDSPVAKQYRALGKEILKRAPERGRPKENR